MGGSYHYIVYEEVHETPLVFESDPVTDGLIEYIT